MSDRVTAAEAFDAADPDLTPAEKETVFRFAKPDARVRFFTAERGIGSRLLRHPLAEIGGVTVVDGDGRPEKAPTEVEPTDHVVGVRGSIPVSALAIITSPRKTEQHADIVSERVLGVEP